MKKLVIIGAGQYSKVVASSLSRKYKLIGFIDEGRTGTHIGLPIFGSSIEEVPKYEKCCYFVALGEVEPRKRWYDTLVEKGLEVINVIDKTANIAKDVRYGTGNYFGKNVIVNSGTVIGDNNMFNTASIVEHHCKIGSHIRIAPATTLCGVITVGDSAFLGSNSTFIGVQKIGEHAIVGAGAVVLGNVEPYTTVVGVPAKVIKERK